jgi:hypothetical protein
MTFFLLVTKDIDVDTSLYMSISEMNFDVFCALKRLNDEE